MDCRNLIWTIGGGLVEIAVNLIDSHRFYQIYHMGLFGLPKKIYKISSSLSLETYESELVSEVVSEQLS